MRRLKKSEQYGIIRQEGTDAFFVALAFKKIPPILVRDSRGNRYTIRVLRRVVYNAEETFPS